MMVMEFWTDWFDYWGCSQNSLDNFLFRRHLEMTINRGASANFYMFLVWRPNTKADFQIDFDSLNVSANQNSHLRRYYHGPFENLFQVLNYSIIIGIHKWKATETDSNRFIYFNQGQKSNFTLVRRVSNRFWNICDGSTITDGDVED